MEALTVVPPAALSAIKAGAQTSSYWLGRPREGFTALMWIRANEMSNTREGYSIIPPILGMKNTRRGVLD